ncbi:MAG TPA: FUSC family protein [Verrucomicrobiae bacterium]|jgi:multidrug resistance protein MdtO|nr:FUSC family protein [Verrucomicrobiae bacterium]
MTPTTFVCPKDFRPAWLVWLRREMAPFPGRVPMTVRLVVSVSIVTVISLALQVPQLAFSAFFCVFATKEHRGLTLFTGILFIVGATGATIINLLLYGWVFDYPEYRVPVMACLIFSAMFLSRTFVIGPLGFIIGFFSALMLTVGEAAPDTETLVRNELWLYVGIVYPIALAVFVNQLLLPTDPWMTLVQALELRLDAASTALKRVIKDGSAGGQNNQRLMNLATRGSGPMFALLHFAESDDQALCPRHPFLVETISAASHLVNATASLEFRDARTVSAEDIVHAKTLLSEIEQIKVHLPEKERVLASRKTPLEGPALPQLRELAFAVESLRDTMIPGHSDYSSTNVAKPRQPLFNKDAFTNPTHVQFALKVTFAAMFCYILYNALDWPGISTSFVTCCFIALGNTGATIYKSWLRFFGCLAGGLLGYLSIFLVIPHMVSITSLVLLTAAGTALAGWIASGSERIAYAGVQLAFAFYLSIFQGFEPQADLAVARDRLAGILLGTVVSAAMFRYVWPEHAADQLRVTLARVLRILAQLVCLPKPGLAMEADEKKTKALHGSLSTDLDSVMVLSDQAAVENVMFDNPKNFSTTALEHITSHVQALGLITTALLRRTKLEEWQKLSPSAQASETDLRGDVADYLKRLAISVEKHEPLPPDNLEPACAKWNLSAAGIVDNDRPRLVRRLVNQVQSLI